MEEHLDADIEVSAPLIVGELTLHRVARRKIGSSWLPSVNTLEKAYLCHSSDAVGPGDVQGYDANYDLLIPVFRIGWADGEYER